MEKEVLALFLQAKHINEELFYPFSIVTSWVSVYKCKREDKGDEEKALHFYEKG